MRPWLSCTFAISDGKVNIYHKGDVTTFYFVVLDGKEDKVAFQLLDLERSLAYG